MLIGFDEVCFAIFIMEAVAKIIVLGELYWQDGWCVLDFVLVVISVVGALFTLIITQIASGSNKSNQTGVFRMVRLYKSGKMIKLLRSAKAIRTVRILESSARLRTLVNAIVATISGGLLQMMELILIVMFTYSIIGMHIFGVKIDPTNLSMQREYGVFSDLINSLIFTFQLFTGEAWWEQMYSAMELEPGAGHRMQVGCVVRALRLRLLSFCRLAIRRTPPLTLRPFSSPAPQSAPSSSSPST